MQNHNRPTTKQILNKRNQWSIKVIVICESIRHSTTELKQEKCLKDITNALDFSKRLAYYFAEINALSHLRPL